MSSFISVSLQVNSQEIKFDLEESSDEKKEPHINTGTRESGARSDSEYVTIFLLCYTLTPY